MHSIYVLKYAKYYFKIGKKKEKNKETNYVYKKIKDNKVEEYEEERKSERIYEA